MKKEKKSHFNLWIYVIIIVCILSSSIAYSALNASVTITGDVVIEKPKGPPLYDEIKKNAVMDNIKSTFVSSDTGINFAEISSDTNGKGVYERKGTENQQYPIYYYRGEVDNNNVIFANYCWKIVRTTETGGVKLIFNGTPSSSNTCNNTGEASQLYKIAFNGAATATSASPVYLGYKYGTVYKIYHSSIGSDPCGSSVSYSGGTYSLYNTYRQVDKTHHYSCGGKTSCSSVEFYIHYSVPGHYDYIKLSGGEKIEDVLNTMFNGSNVNENNSTIKNYIENTWYKNYMIEYSDQLEDTEWCNDRTIYDKGPYNPAGDLTSKLYFEGYRRRENGTPSLECPREVDKFTVGNGRLQYPTGLLTVDEAMLAGGTISNNKSYYLYTGMLYWLGSPCYAYNHAAFTCGVGGFGEVEDHGVYLKYGVRPAVSLKTGAYYTGGDGTASSPYIVD